MTKNRTFTLLLLSLAAFAAGCNEATAPVTVLSEDPAPDTAPAAVPTGLAAVAAPRSSVKLSWDPNTTDPDLQGYLVYRQVLGQVHALVDAPVSDARFIDTDPVRLPCTYAVTSIDEAGNESARTLVGFSFQPEDPERRSDS